MSRSPSVDPAIIRALGLSSSNTHATIHGGSGFASTYRLTTPQRSVFVKTASGKAAGVMFEGEHASLNAINQVVPSLCPQSLVWGKVDNGDGYFLATEFLDMTRGPGRATTANEAEGSDKTLAEKLAKLHSTPAPTPDGYDQPQFGFPGTTCCGDTPQNNAYMSCWADFFANHRLLSVLERGEKNNGIDPELRRLIDRTVKEVVPRLLGDDHLGGVDGVRPVVVHGDLWSGNHGRGSFVGRDTASPEEPGAIEEVIFDPSACYAHAEYEHGIMNMFGGFGNSFWKEYHQLLPKTEPADEYKDRVALYESYHHLNHWAIFGGGYRSGAMGLLKSLLKTYGSKS